MNAHYKKFLIALTLLILAAGIARAAYTAPNGFPEDAVVVPVTNGNAVQIKIGGLSVNAFYGRGTARLGHAVQPAPAVDPNPQYTVIGDMVSSVQKGALYGCPKDASGNPAPCTQEIASTVYVGTASAPSGMLVAENVQTKIQDKNDGLTSDLLINGSTKFVCATGIGELVLCDE